MSFNNYSSYLGARRCCNNINSNVVEGPQGAQGFGGPIGPAGTTGSLGPQGPRGTTGCKGATGATGAQGPRGSGAGDQGPTGAQGATGSQGSTGEQGPQGATGPSGSGAQGATGSTGAQGATGSTGSTGAQGATGSTGAQGATGSTGAQGATGSTGAQGATGSIGAQGATGEQGPQGSTGEQGPQGATGASPFFNTSLIYGPTGYTGVGYTGDVMIFGGLYVSGGIDPTFLTLEPQASNPIPTGLTGIWVNSTNGNLQFNDDIVYPTSIPTYDEVLNAGNVATEKIAIITGSGSLGTRTNTIDKGGISIVDTDGTDFQQTIINNQSVGVVDIAGGVGFNSALSAIGLFITNLPVAIYTQISNTLFEMLNGSSSLSLSASQITFATPQITSYFNSSTLNLNDVTGGRNFNTTIQASGIYTQSTLSGYTANNNLTIVNNNTTAGNTTGVPSIQSYKSGRNAIGGDIISSQSYYAKNYAGTKTEFARIEASVRNTSLNNDDGAIGFFGATQSGGVNVLAEFFRLNGADNENNTFRPLDMNGNDLKTSSGSLSVTSTGSSGTGNLSVNAKGSLTLASLADDIAVSNSLTMAVNKVITLNDSSPNAVQTTIGNGNMTINDTTNTLSTTLDQATLTVVTSGTTTIYGSSGFFNSDNSIECSSANGFRMNYGSSTNTTTLDLNDLTIYNATTAPYQDTILLQNSGGGNPVLNLQSNNTTTSITNAMGASVQGMGLTTTNNLTFAYKQVAINNPTGSSSIIQHTDNLDNLPFIVATGNSLELSMGQDLVLSGANIISGSAGGSSGQHLRILLNGVYYKIKLEND
jgi:collagen type VII alpha